MDGVPHAVRPAFASAFPSLLRGVQISPHPVVVQFESNDSYQGMPSGMPKSSF
jgi:hypothetical protein